MSKLTTILSALTMIVITTGCNSVWHKPANNYTGVKLPQAREEHQIGGCGKTAVERVILYYWEKNGETHKKINYNHIKQKSFHNTLTLWLFAKSNKLEAKLCRANIHDIEYNLKGKNPVYTALTSDDSWYMMFVPKELSAHGVVVTGYSKEKNIIYYYSNDEGPFEMDANTFIRLWQDNYEVTIIFKYK